jgi:hypothetical protein
LGEPSALLRCVAAWVFTLAYVVFALVVLLTWRLVPPRQRMQLKGPLLRDLRRSRCVEIVSRISRIRPQKGGSILCATLRLGKAEHGSGVALGLRQTHGNHVESDAQHVSYSVAAKSSPGRLSTECGARTELLTETYQ